MKIFRLFVAFTLVRFALSPAAQAVVPAPDGGYPNFTTAEGTNALKNLTTGAANTGVGWYSLFGDTTASFNTGVGAGTLVLNSGDQNTATGAAALLLNTTGNLNTANGALALLNNTEGASNTATGVNALSSNTTGSFNTAIGYAALQNNPTGNFNIAVGWNAGIGVNGANNVICIGDSGSNVNNSCFITNIRGTVTVNNNALPVVVDSSNQLGTMSSSRRFKKEIKPMRDASEAVLALKPVTFHYKSDDTNRPEFGLIAEEVAEVNPDLVVRDEKGEIYTVRYDAVNAMLLNEFLKEHRKNEEQGATIAQLKSAIGKQEAAAAKEEATIARQQKQIEALTTGLQKVSAQFELGKAAPRTVLNSQ